MVSTRKRAYSVKGISNSSATGSASMNAFHKDSARRELSFSDNDIIQTFDSDNSPSKILNVNNFVQHRAINCKANEVSTMANGMHTKQVSKHSQHHSENGYSNHRVLHNNHSSSEIHDITVTYSEESMRSYTYGTLRDFCLLTFMAMLCYIICHLVYTTFGYIGLIALTAVGISLLSWTITYFDSMKPGVLPPSPMSPALYRHQSGHTFHMGYTMSIVNGIVFFCVAYWLHTTGRFSDLPLL